MNLGDLFFIICKVCGSLWHQGRGRKQVDNADSKCKHINLFPDNKIQIFSDGNDDYKSTLPEYYVETCVDYGQIIKIRESGKMVDKI